jgi:hypothetical protein
MGLAVDAAIGAVVLLLILRSVGASGRAGLARRTLERAAITSHEKGVQPLRGWFAIQS